MDEYMITKDQISNLLRGLYVVIKYKSFEEHGMIEIHEVKLIPLSSEVLHT